MSCELLKKINFEKILEIPLLKKKSERKNYDNK